MPVGGMNVCECPTDPSRAQAASYVRLIVNVFAIVVVNEIVMESLSKGDPGYRREEKTRQSYDQTLGAL